MFAADHRTKSFPVTALPTDHDVMAGRSTLINRAIAMHLLREGQFDVARTFMDEAHQDILVGPSVRTDDTAMDTEGPESSSLGFSGIQSQELQGKFETMYAILRALKAHDLTLAIEWARSNSAELEARGSDLEFELCKLQYVWLFREADPQKTTAERQNLSAAFHYARDHFSRFHLRHLKEIQKLASAMVFAPNIRESPYAALFEIGAAFDEVAVSFTREFCSLLGLSAESPLYVAATAGTIALPRLVKFIGATRSKRTEWTTANELAFETPLPDSMIYHSIFVCPVSKEQTTDANPPMMLPCGHVLAKESLQNLTKGVKFKCPYCPSEGQIKDARHIIL